MKGEPLSDWDSWFDLKYFRIYQGEHFEVSVKAMCNRLRVAANWRRLSLSVEKSDDYIDVRVLGSLLDMPAYMQRNRDMEKNRKNEIKDDIAKEKKKAGPPPLRYGPQVLKELQDFFKSEEVGGE